MRKISVAAMLGLALVATACAKKNADEGVPADTATMAPAPAPAPAPMDTGAAAMDTTMKDTTVKTTTTTTTTK